MAEQVASLFDQVEFDNTIKKKHMRSYHPVDPNQLGSSDVIRLIINNQNTHTLPSESYIKLEGVVTKEDGTVTAHTSYVNNAFAYLISELKWELGGVELVNIKNCGLASTLKALLCFSPDDAVRHSNSGWLHPLVKMSTAFKEDNKFSVCLPLKFLIPAFEDYTWPVINVKQELVIIRSRTDNDGFMVLHDAAGAAKEKIKVKLTNVTWRMPHVEYDDSTQAAILANIRNDKSISMAYRTWNLYEHPNMPASTPLTWNLKSASHLQKPRYVIFFTQTARINNTNSTSSEFDHNNVHTVRLYLNSDYYPYENQNCNFGTKAIADLYENYVQFQASYYGRESRPLLTRAQFLTHAPMFVIDCSKQPESLKTGSVDCRLEVNASGQIPDFTTGFCMVVNDNLATYSPLTGAVHKFN